MNNRAQGVGVGSHPLTRKVEDEPGNVITLRKTHRMTPEIPQVLPTLYNALNCELKKPYLCIGSIASLLVRTEDDIKALKKLEWSYLVDELIHLLKRCVVLPYTLKNQVYNNGMTVTTEADHISSHKNEDELRKVALYAHNILASILFVLSPKYGFKFFESLMTQKCENTQSYLTFLQNRELREHFLLNSALQLNDLLKLIVSSIRKAKCTLSMGEPKAVAYGHVQHTSFSASAARLLGEFSVFLMDTMESDSDILLMDHVYEALVTTAGAMPFVRMDEPVFRRLVFLAYNSMRENDAKVPIDTVLSLMSLLLTVDWNFEDSFPSLSRSEFQKFAVLSSNRVLGALVYRVKLKTLENIIKEAKTGENAVGVLISFAKHNFEDFLPMSLDCLRLIRELVSVATPLLECCARMNKAIGATHGESIQNLTTCTCLIVQSLVLVRTMTRSVGEFLNENNLDKKYMSEFRAGWYNLMSHKDDLESLFNWNEIICALVDCYSAVNESLFEQLDHNQRVFCIVNILAFSSHSSDLIRSRGARCLALFLEFRKLVENDEQFILDCLDTIDFMSKIGDANSRFNFGWAAGNLCDALAKYHSNTDFPALGWNVYCKIYHLGIRMAKDIPKMKYNANRALGGLVNWTPSQFLDEEELESFVKNIASVLADQVAVGNDFKARWNASHALGNLIRKEALWQKFFSSLADFVFPAFIRSLSTSENFKERSHCIRGIIGVKSRIEYCSYFREIWIVLLEAFNVNPESRIPVPHGLYEKYLEEVSRGILHLATMTDPIKDLGTSGELESIFIGNYETVVSVLDNVQSTNQDEQDETLKLAITNLSEIVKHA